MLWATLRPFRCIEVPGDFTAEILVSSEITRKELQSSHDSLTMLLLASQELPLEGMFGVSGILR